MENAARGWSANVSMESAVDTSNELVVAYGPLLDVVGPERTAELLRPLGIPPRDSHALPTESAPAKRLEGKDSAVIAALVDEHPTKSLGGSALHWRTSAHLRQEIDALVRTSPTELKKPHAPGRGRTPSFDIFGQTRCSITVPQGCTGVSTTGCWAMDSRAAVAARTGCARRSSVRAAGIGSDPATATRYVTAKVSRGRGGSQYFAHRVAKLAQGMPQTSGANLTLVSRYTAPPRKCSMNLWSHRVEMSETLTGSGGRRPGLRSRTAPSCMVHGPHASRAPWRAQRRHHVPVATKKLLADLRTVLDSLRARRCRTRRVRARANADMAGCDVRVPYGGYGVPASHSPRARTRASRFPLQWRAGQARPQ